MIICVAVPSYYFCGRIGAGPAQILLLGVLFLLHRLGICPLNPKIYFVWLIFPFNFLSSRVQWLGPVWIGPLKFKVGARSKVGELHRSPTVSEYYSPLDLEVLRILWCTTNTLYISPLSSPCLVSLFWVSQINIVAFMAHLKNNKKSTTKCSIESSSLDYLLSVATNGNINTNSVLDDGIFMIFFLITKTESYGILF